MKTLTLILLLISSSAFAAEPGPLLSFKHMRFLRNKQRTDYIAAVRLALKKANIPMTKTLNEVENEPGYFVIPQNEPSWNYLRLEIGLTCVKKQESCTPLYAVTNKVLSRVQASE